MQARDTLYQKTRLVSNIIITGRRMISPARYDLPLKRFEGFHYYYMPERKALFISHEIQRIGIFAVHTQGYMDMVFVACLAGYRG